MPRLIIPTIDVDGEEVEPTDEGGHGAKKGGKRRKGAFLPQELLDVWYRRFPGNAVAKVFFLVLVHASRYDKGLAFLSVKEIMAATGLSKRSVHYAIRQLKLGGFIRREGRYQIALVDPSKQQSKHNRPKSRSRKVQPACTFKGAKFGPKGAKFRSKGATRVFLPFS
jgi:hypothetical protein